MDENIKRAWQGKVAHLEARLQEAEAKYEERVNQHEEYIAFSDEEINGLIEKKRLVMARLAEAERKSEAMRELLLSFATSSWLMDHHKQRIHAVLLPRTADSAPAVPTHGGRPMTLREVMDAEDSAEDRPVCDCGKTEPCKSPLYRDCKRLTPTVPEVQK